MEMAGDTHEDRPDSPDVYEGVGERDLRFGMTVGVVMAVAAIALTIGFSL